MVTHGIRGEPHLDHEPLGSLETESTDSRVNLAANPGCSSVTSDKPLYLLLKGNASTSLTGFGAYAHTFPNGEVVMVTKGSVPGVT